MSELLPRLVYQMSVHGALIAGSQAKRLAGDEIDNDSSDWDLLVPYRHWQKIALLIPEYAAPNKFGGWRFVTDSHGSDDVVEVDVWPGDVVTYLTECKTKYGGNVYVVDYIHNRVFSSQVRDLSLPKKPKFSLMTEGGLLGSTPGLSVTPQGIRLDTIRTSE